MAQENGDSQYMLGVISGKIDLILLQQADDKRVSEARFAKIESVQDRHAEGLTGLKRDRAWVVALAAGLSAAITGVAAFFGAHH